MPLPTYNLRCRHSLRDVVGFDVVATSWTAGAPDGQVTLRVTDIVLGATNAFAAQEQARAHRTGPGRYGYTCERYACGCRAIANYLGARGTNPAPTFIDLEPAR